MRQDIREMILETYQDMFDAKIVNEITLREIKAMCLPAVRAYGPRAIVRVRRRLKLSQAAFAKFLNVSVSTIQKWEIGNKHPSGPALKLLSIVDEKGLPGVV